MIDYYPDWPHLAAGDRVIIRDRSTALERITTVKQLLREAEGEGPGFIDGTGATIRLFHFTACPANIRSEAPQAAIDEIFCELTKPQHYSPGTSPL